MTKGWQSMALDRQVGKETAVTWYPEIGPVAAEAMSVSVVVTTLIPLSSPPKAVLFKETPLTVKAMAEPAAIDADPVRTKAPSTKELKE